MDRITKFSIKNPTVIVVATLLIIFGGIYAAGELKRETMPDVSIPFAAVVTPYPGAAPTDVNDKVSDPMATAVSGVAARGSVTVSLKLGVLAKAAGADPKRLEASITKRLKAAFEA